ncbi:MAG: DUF4118 domain-containing protein, partial [Candidatus Rokuibacteriota bacterium]
MLSGVQRNGAVAAGIGVGLPAAHGEDGKPSVRRSAGGFGLRAYGGVVATVILATAVAWLMFRWFDLADLIMVYLLGVVLVAMRHGRAPSLLAALLSVGAFNFFFVPPYFTFAVADIRYAITFLVMLVVAAVIGGLTVRMRAQAEAARQREQHTAALYALSRDLANTRGIDEIVGIVTRHIGDLFQSHVVVLLPDTAGQLRPSPACRLGWIDFHGGDLACAQEAYDERQPPGLGTHLHRRGERLYVPLLAFRGPVGVICVTSADRRSFAGAGERHQL